MHRALSKNLLNASLFAALLLTGTAQAASNPFAEARPGSRLPTIAEESSDKCAGSGADQAQPTSMPCGSAGKCAGSMLESAKPDSAPTSMPCGAAGKCAGSMQESAKPDSAPAQSDKCGGGSGSGN
jgi:hypothetical protein